MLLALISKLIGVSSHRVDKQQKSPLRTAKSSRHRKACRIGKGTLLPSPGDPSFIIAGEHTHPLMDRLLWAMQTKSVGAGLDEADVRSDICMWNRIHFDPDFPGYERSLQIEFNGMLDEAEKVRGRPFTDLEEETLRREYVATREQDLDKFAHRTVHLHNGAWFWDAHRIPLGIATGRGIDPFGDAYSPFKQKRSKRRAALERSISPTSRAEGDSALPGYAELSIKGNALRAGHKTTIPPPPLRTTADQDRYTPLDMPGAFPQSRSQTEVPDSAAAPPPAELDGHPISSEAVFDVAQTGTDTLKPSSRPHPGTFRVPSATPTPNFSRRSPTGPAPMIHEQQPKSTHQTPSRCSAGKSPSPLTGSQTVRAQALRAHKVFLARMRDAETYYDRQAATRQRAALRSSPAAGEPGFGTSVAAHVLGPACHGCSERDIGEDREQKAAEGEQEETQEQLGDEMEVDTIPIVLDQAIIEAESKARGVLRSVESGLNVDAEDALLLAEEWLGLPTVGHAAEPMGGEESGLEIDDMDLMDESW